MEISLDCIILDSLNLEWAIDNINEGKLSYSKHKPMDIITDKNGNYYLVDGYHRLVELVRGGYKKTEVKVLNKSFEEFKITNTMSVGCKGGCGNEYCNNFKTIKTTAEVVEW